MSGIRKILAGLINPRLKLQLNKPEESPNIIVQNNSQQANIGEKLGGVQKNTEGLLLKQNGIVNNGAKVSQQSGINNQTNINSVDKIPENPADRIINKVEQQGLQDISNTQKQIDSQTQKNVVLEKATNNSAGENVIAQNSTNNSASNKLNQILFGDDEPIQNNNQSIKQNTNVLSENTTTQNIITNEKASQAISYQVNNDVVKNTNKNQSEQQFAVTNKPNETSVQNQPKQEGQPPIVKENNIPQNINQEKHVLTNQPQNQNTQVNNTAQTIYNEQYKEVFNDINKTTNQIDSTQKPNINNVQENITTQNIINNEKASQAISYQVNNDVIKNTNKNQSEQQFAVADKTNETSVQNQPKQEGQPPIVKENNIQQNINQEKPVLTNQPQNQNTQVNNTAQTIYNEQYKEVFNDINKTTNQIDTTQKPNINNVQENITTQNIINNEKASQAISYQVNNDVIKNTNKNQSEQQFAVTNKPNETSVQNQPKQEGQPPIVKENNIQQNINQEKPVLTNQPQSQNTQVNNTAQTIYNEQYKEVFNDINKTSSQIDTTQKPNINNVQENITTQNIINNEKASQAISYQVNNDVVKNTNKNQSEQQFAVTNKPNETSVQNQPKQEGQPPIVKENNIPQNINQEKHVLTNQPQNQNTQVNNTAQTIYNEQYKEVFNDINKTTNQIDTTQKSNIDKTNKISIQNQITEKSENVNKNSNIDFDKITNSINRSNYVKELLGLPKNLSEMLFISQNSNSTINNNTLLLRNLNQDILKNQKVLSQIFDENPVVQPNINGVQELSNNIQTPPVPADNKDAIALIFSGMVKMPEISALILKNSKHAVSQLVIAMASVNNYEINEQLKDTLSALNMCISLADSGTPTQTLKSLLLLYLPWLPLNDGVGFDLEIESTPGENESNDSKLTVLIQTRHFSNVKGTFTLTSSNSVEAFILCSDDFPKVTLQKMLKEECDSHSMSTKIDIEQVTPIRKEANSSQEAKVSLSATNEMNPYLLLMAHSFIRNTIDIDTRAEYSLAANKTT